MTRSEYIICALVLICLQGVLCLREISFHKDAKCRGTTEWQQVNYEAVGLISLQKDDMTVNKASESSCMTSSSFIMEAGSTLEFSAYLETVLDNSGITVLVYNQLRDDVPVTNYTYTKNSKDFVTGWKSHSVKIENNIIGYVTLLGFSQENEIVVVNSFRYISNKLNHRFDVNDVKSYGRNSAREDGESTTTESTTSEGTESPEVTQGTETETDSSTTTEAEITDSTTTEGETESTDPGNTDSTTTEGETESTDPGNTDSTTTEGETESTDPGNTDSTTTEGETESTDPEITDSTTTEGETESTDPGNTDSTATDGETESTDSETTDSTATDGDTESTDSETTDSTTTEEVTETPEPEPVEDESGLEAWEITLIVLGTVAGVGLIGFLIYYFVIKP